MDQEQSLAASTLDGQSTVEPRPIPVETGLYRFSQGLARIEAQLAGLLICAVFCLLMANVVSRAFSRPLVWTDELAIYLMAASAFIGASVALAHNQHIAITLITGFLSERRAIVLAIAVKLILAAFFVLLAMMLWRWLDPVGLLTAESLDSFSATSFNFVYQEPTVTLGVPKIWFWLVLPLFCLTGLTHLAAGISANLTMLKELSQ